MVVATPVLFKFYASAYNPWVMKELNCKLDARSVCNSKWILNMANKIIMLCDKFIGGTNFSLQYLDLIILYHHTKHLS